MEEPISYGNLLKIKGCFNGITVNENAVDANGDKKESKASNNDHFETDRSRVLFSPFFRALQQKTQVFPLEMDRTVRTRLIHSLEVLNTGGRLARRIARDERAKENGLKGPMNRENFVCVVKNACLIHDIGNPPFGHFGETAIKRWFMNKCDAHAIHAELILPEEKEKKLTKEEERARAREEKEEYELRKKDFTYFDGNQQGIRVVMKLKPSKYGDRMNLTYQTILSAIKCPRSCRCAGNNKSKGRDDKAGYFCTEETDIQKMLDCFEFKPNKRFPLSYIMEAADDISYCMSDIDDGLKKGIISHKEFVKEIRAEWKKVRDNLSELDENVPEEFPAEVFPLPDVTENGVKPWKRYDFGREIALRWTDILIQKVAEEYWEADVQKSIREGNYTELIRKESLCGVVLNTLKNIARRKLYLASEIVNLELSGLEIISGLLNHFCMLLKLNSVAFMNIVLQRDEPGVERRIYAIIDSRFREGYKREILEKAKDVGCSINQEDMKAPIMNEKFEECINKVSFLDEWFLRAHMIVDHITAMTDDYALMQFNYFKGIITV